MIDINKKYRTRGGREVRIYAIDGWLDGMIMTHGAVKNKSGYWEIANWYTEHGKFYGDIINHPFDLIEVRPRHKRTVWLNVYGSGIVPEACSSKERANLAAACNRIACIKVELDFEEGEGL